MPRARLQYAIAIDAATSAAGSTDPVVHVYGATRGQSMPFVVRRGWAGPQGSYVEEFRVVRTDTRVTAFRSAPRILELAGEYYTDELEDRIDGVQLEVGEYELVFTVDNDVMPGVPVFVEPGPGAPGGPEVAVDPLIDEAMKKSDIVWIEVPGQTGQQSRAAWHLWHEGAAYVVFSGSEQQLPGLDNADSVVVHTRSKDKWGLIVAWRAAVDLVPPASPAWNEVTPLLVGKRLNNRDGDNAPTRWAKECLIARLTPTGEVVEGPGNERSDDRREAPAPSSATTETRIPITLHKKPVAKR